MLMETPIEGGRKKDKDNQAKTSEGKMRRGEKQEWKDWGTYKDRGKGAILLKEAPKEGGRGR